MVLNVTLCNHIPNVSLILEHPGIRARAGGRMHVRALQHQLLHPTLATKMKNPLILKLKPIARKVTHLLTVPVLPAMRSKGKGRGLSEVSSCYLIFFELTCVILSPEPDKPPKPTAPIVPGTQGIDAYKRGDFREAIAVFDKTLLGNLEHAIRVSLISNRAHAYEKVSSLKL